jgi:hypothetical protein
MTIAAIKRMSFFNERADMKRAEYEREGRELIARDVSHEAHLSAGNKGKWPTGSVWSYQLQAVYGPAKPRRGASE